MGILEHLTPPVWAILITIVSTIVGVAYMFGRQHTRLDELERETEELYNTIEAYHGKMDQKCTMVQTSLATTVTKKMLEDHCNVSQSKCTENVCRRIEAIAAKWDKLEQKVDHNQEEMNKQTAAIIKALGRLEGILEKQ